MSGPRAWAAILLALAASSPGEAPAELRAEEITAANAAELLIGGPDAIGGIGDYYLANDRVEVVVDHPSRRHGISNHGGTLVDAGLRDRRGEDQLARISPLVNLSQRVFVGYDAIRAEVAPDGAFARLVVTSPGMRSLPRGGAIARALDVLVPEPEALARVRVETVYEVRPGEPFVRLRTRFDNQGDATAPVFAYGDLWMRGGRGMRAFLGNVLSPEQARGFHHRSFSAAAILGSLDAMAPFSHLVMSGVPGPPPVTYALFSPERSEQGLSFFGVSGDHVNLAGVFHDDPGWPELDYLRLARALRGGIPPGESWEIERRLLVIGGADVASATDRLLPALGVPADGGVEGAVAPAGLRSVVHVDDAAGRPVTQMRAAAGRYRARLAPGAYRLTYRAPHRPPVTREVRVEAGAVTRLPDLRWPEVGALRLDPAFADGGAGRIVFLGIDGTPTPVFGAELLDARLDGALQPSATRRNDVAFVGGAADPREIALPFGRYRLVATRGPEWDAAERRVEVGPGAPLRLPPFALSRVASLPGHLSCDLHVHAQASDDSATSNEDRLRDFVAAGVQLLVATDHENVARYDEALAALGLAGRIRVVHGVEVTSSAPSDAAPYTLGHQNAWPVTHRPFAHRHGAPASQDVPAGELFSRLRRELGVLVVQLNHPRGPTLEREDGNFFSHQGSAGRPVDPTLPLGAPEHAALRQAAPDGTRAVDFDVIELLNGASRAQYRLVRDDFHWLLRQGLRRGATANSDTHGPDDPAGLPRNYVRVAGGGAADVPSIAEALRAGRSFGTNGPLVARFRVAGAGSGETVAASGGRAAVEYEVVAAPWVPTEEVRLLVNGEVVRRSAALSGRFALELSRDAFVTLEAGAPLEVDPQAWLDRHRGPYTVIAPGHVPTAFTNPVYVDADGDGRWTPPGLPPREPELAPAFHAAAIALAIAVLWAVRRRRA